MSEQHDNLRDNIGQAIKDAFDEIDAEITGFDIHDARDIDIFTDKVMETLTDGTSITRNMRGFIEGMSVSVDVSTGEHDAGNRYFGTVSEVMDDSSDKHGVTLLVQDAKPNFAQAVLTEEEEAVAFATAAHKQGILGPGRAAELWNMFKERRAILQAPQVEPC